MMMADDRTGAVPEISVILAVFNGETYLDECIHSIRRQTFTEFEFIIVDDASTDSTPEIVRRHAAQDSRIAVLTNEWNQERSISRNAAMTYARSELIAVMDADDIAMPNRLEKQITFMRANPNVLICGGAVTHHETGESVFRPLSDEAIRAHMLWGSPFAQPTVIFRRKPVMDAGGYDPAMTLSEDYDLWIRLAALPGWSFANLDEVVLRYRVHPHADRHTYRARIVEQSATCIKAYLLRLGMPETALDMEAHLKLCFQNEPRPVSLERARTWCERLMDWNRQSHIFDPRLFDEMCMRQLHGAYVKAPWLPAGLKRLIPPSVKHWAKKRIFAVK